MLAYIILFTLLGLVFFIPNKHFGKYGIAILMIIFAIFFGIRNNVAVDDANYIQIFLRFSRNLENATIEYTNIEIIFKIICRILGILHLNYKSLFLIYSSLSFLFLGLFLKKINLSKKELLIFTMAFLAMVFFTYMTTMRQFLAITMALYGMTLVMEKKYIRGFSLMLISALFHNSTIIMLFLLPLFSSKIRIDYRVKIILLMLILVLGKIGVINNIISFVTANLKYNQYIVEETNKAFAGSGIVHLFLLVVYIIQCIIMKNNNTEQKADNHRTLFLERGQFIYLILFFATINSGYAIRVSYLYLIFMCFLFATVIRQIKTEKIVKAITIATYAILIILISKNMISNQNTKFMENNFSIDFFNENRIE